MNLVEAICCREFGYKRYRIRRFVVYKCWSPEQPWVAEILINRLGMGYTAGRSNASGNKPGYDVWDDWSGRAYIYTPFQVQFEERRQQLQARLEAISKEHSSKLQQETRSMNQAVYLQTNTNDESMEKIRSFKTLWQPKLEEAAELAALATRRRMAASGLAKTVQEYGGWLFEHANEHQGKGKGRASHDDEDDEDDDDDDDFFSRYSVDDISSDSSSEDGMHDGERSKGLGDAHDNEQSYSRGHEDYRVYHDEPLGNADDADEDEPHGHDGHYTGDTEDTMPKRKSREGGSQTYSDEGVEEQDLHVPDEDDDDEGDRDEREGDEGYEAELRQRKVERQIFEKLFRR
ncbi:hypothetical protein HDK64DRAFT_258501 [Phyllosticta capitalensis]